MRASTFWSVLAASAALLSGCNAKRNDPNSLILANDPAVCASPEAIRTALSAGDDDYENYLGKGMPAIKVDTISASGVNKDIHEISCSGNAHFNSPYVPGDQKITITYSFRPSLDEGGGYVAQILGSADVKSMIEAQWLWWQSSAVNKAQASATEMDPEPTNNGSSSAISNESGGSAPDESYSATMNQYSFADYAETISSQPATYPKFEGSQRKYRLFRTAIREGVAAGVNFGGQYAIVMFGCGTDCSSGYIVRLSDGMVFDLPVGGEDTPDLDMDYKPDSRLLKASWKPEGFDQPCTKYAYFVWNEGKFDTLLTSSDHCST